MLLSTRIWRCALRPADACGLSDLSEVSKDLPYLFSPVIKAWEDFAMCFSLMQIVLSAPGIASSKCNYRETHLRACQPKQGECLTMSQRTWAFIKSYLGFS